MRNDGLFFENVKRWASLLLFRSLKDSKNTRWIVWRMMRFALRLHARCSLGPILVKNWIHQENLNTKMLDDHQILTVLLMFFTRQVLLKDFYSNFYLNSLYVRWAVSRHSAPSSSLVQNKTLSHNLELTFLCRAESLSWNQLSSMVIVGIRPSFNVPS